MSHPPVNYSLTSNKGRILPLNEELTIDTKFNYILKRRSSTQRAWLKMEGNCKRGITKDQFANWLNLAPVGEFMKPYAVVDLQGDEDTVTMKMSISSLS